MSANAKIGPGAVDDFIRAVEKTAGVKTQVVSLDLGAGAAESLASGTVPVSGTVAVSGTVSTNTGLSQPLTDTQLRATPVPVSGTFYQATQPVSIASMPTTPVTGTFWQATQPVSIASMPSTPVTGTFWQATQPVSIASWTGLTDTQLRAAPVPVSGTFWQTTQPVSIASMPTTPVTGTFWQATQPVSLATGVAQGTAAALSGAWPAKLTDGTTAVKVTIGNAAPSSTDGALLVNAIDTFAGTAQASGSRAVGTVNYDIVNYNGKGIKVWQDLTVLGASSVCTFSIQEKDPVSGKFITILSSAATGAGINATGTAKLVVYPGLTAVANSVGSDVLPVNIRIVSTVATAASTFSIGYSIIP